MNIDQENEMKGLDEIGSTSDIIGQEKVLERKKNLEFSDPEPKKTLKTLNNTTAVQAKENVKDIIFWGNGDTFKLISKASSVNEGWLKSTKAMEITHIGCVVQVTTQQGDNVAESITFVPGVKIFEEIENEKVISRRLVAAR